MKKEDKNFFSSMKADSDDWAEWGGREAKIADLKLRGNFPHRHPVNKEHWNNISDVSILGAALYTMGIDPDAIDDENHNTNHQGADFDGLILSERDERLAIIKSALRAGVIDITDLKGDIANPDDYSKILKSSFESWLKDKKFSNKSIPIPAYPDLQDKTNKPNANDGTKDASINFVETQPVEAKPKEAKILKRRVEKIIELLKESTCDLHAIPRGGKKSIYNKCVELDKKLFPSESVFNKAWSYASTKGLLKTAHKENLS